MFILSRTTIAKSTAIDEEKEKSDVNYDDWNITSIDF
jgi:hypothetical protein